jgi:hypothetical protein
VKTRSAFGLTVLAAWPLLGAGASPADFVLGVAKTLSTGDAGAFREAFDPAMPGLKALQRGAGALMAQAQAESRIEFDRISGEGAERLLELDWALDITQRGGIPGLTHRSAKVRCRLADHGGRWLIASFEPADFLAPPPDMGALWDMFHEVASALNNGRDYVPQFLSFFDPAFAAKVHLEQGVRGAMAGGELQPSLDLATNEGDDRVRTVGIDWAMDLVEMNVNGSGVVKVRKNDHVTFRVARTGKRWRIESFEPADLFQSALP